MDSFIYCFYECSVARIGTIGNIIYGIDRKRRERKGALRRAALWMEQSPAVPADMDAVKDWWQAVAAEKDGGVDDITWQDLDMDAIFTAMNHTASGVGEEQLYAILRDTQTPEDTLSRRRRWVEALRKDTLVLKFLEHNFIWPGLDQIEASREAEPLMRKLLNVVLTSPEMAGRTEREIYQRITALGSMCISVCYTSVLEGKPDNIDNMKPILYDIIRRAQLYRENIAVAVIPQDGVDRVAAAQAADELLTLKGVKASFVVYRSGEDVLMSARSLGEINVQVILEALGGGGNSATAGGRVENGDIDTVQQDLLAAIDHYFEK